MKVIMDALGGDNAPLEVIKGAIEARKEYKVEISLCGERERILKCAADNALSLEGIEICGSGDGFPMEDEPATIMKGNSGCSMSTGLKLLAEGSGDAFVSAGSTGALLVGSTFIIKRIKKIKRAAIGTLIPTLQAGNYLLIDSGANSECRPEMLLQFAVMGSTYMKGIFGLEEPSIGLVNIGAEKNKGTPLQQEAYNLLNESGLNFRGNIEARDIPYQPCDVLVCDGFTGNIVLKLTEGLAMSFAKMMKTMFTKSVVSKMGALCLKGEIKDFKKKLDYTEHGGAPLLGLKKPVIKVHGSSDANAFKNAVRQAIQFHESGAIAEMERLLSEIDDRTSAEESKE